MHSDNEQARTVRVLIETLKLTNGKQSPSLLEIERNSQATHSFVSKTLSKFVGVSDTDLVPVGPRLRVLLAFELARLGRLREAARSLTWREFEQFTSECLKEAGFQTEWNVRVKGRERSWQVDVVGTRGDLMLTIDCKHWNTSNYASRFKNAAEQQRMAAVHLLIDRSFRADKERRLQALVIILSLSEPPSKILDNAVLVSVEQLANFLSTVSPFDTDLPLITETDSSVQNPMSQSLLA